MDLLTLCPFVTSKLIWRAHSGVYALSVIVKATFVLRPGTSTVAPDQDPIAERDQFLDNDYRRSVRIPSDVVPYKPRADVLLVGRACAPGNQPVRSLVTRFVVGEMDKSIEVWCDRAFRMLDGQLLEGKRFAEMPLVWERASGGADSANPVGKRFDGPPDAYGSIAIANLQPLGHFVAKRADTFAPTCYAPIASTWPERRRRLGPLAKGAFDGRWQDKPLPPDLEPTFFLAAPHDQQVAEIRANERIVLENLVPEHPRLVTNLPGLKPRAIADRATGEREEITLVGDTLWVDTDRGVCCVVWRGRIGLRHPQEAGRIAVWVDGLPMTDSTGASGPSHEVIANVTNIKQTLASYHESASSAPALPFASGAPKASQPEIAASVPNETFASATAREKPAISTASHLPMDSLQKQTLPLDYVPPGTATPFDRRALRNSPMMQTVAPHLQASAAVLPFGAPTDAPITTLPDDSWVSPPMELPTNIVSIGPSEPHPFNVAPPPMIGPLATVDTGPEAPAPSNVPDKPAEAVEPPPAKNEPEPEVIALPLEKTAAIAAEIAEGLVDRAGVLHVYALDELAWTENQQRWNAAMTEEQERGKSALRAVYDAAYVQRVEGFRGAITARDYARIMVGIERRKANQVLQELKIQRPAQMPIIRTWAKKIAQSRNLGDEVAAALKAARNE